MIKGDKKENKLKSTDGEKPVKKKKSLGKTDVIIIAVLIAVVTIGLGALNVIFAYNRLGDATPWYVCAYTAIACLGILYFTARWAYKSLKK